MSDDCPHKQREHELERRAHVERSLSRVALFPLPGAVLLPGCPMPLHIFEPRYRRMIADAMDDRRVLAIGKLDGGASGLVHERPPVHPTVGVGIIDVHQPLPDGRSIILVGGVLRAEIVDESETDLPYRQVTVRALDDSLPRERRVEAQDRAETLRQMVLQLSRMLPESGACELARVCAKVPCSQLADMVAGAVVLCSDARQRVLETPSVSDRIALVTDYLTDLLAKISERYDCEQVLN